MKKYLFLFLCVFLLGCSTSANNQSINNESNLFISSDIISEHTISEEEISSFEEEEFEILDVQEKVCKIKINSEIVTYKANKIIDGEKFHASEFLYLQEESDSNNFIVINGGTLILNQTTIVKKGDSSIKDEKILKYGMNSSILVIGNNSKVQISDVAINVFASYSSGIHCLNGGVAEIASTDLLIIAKASHAYSTYRNGMIFSESILTLVDSKRVAAFVLYEGGGLISVLGNNNYIEVHGEDSYVGVLRSGVMILKNIYGYSENSVLFNIKEGASLTLENSLITES